MATVMTPDQNRQEVPAARESARYMPGFGNDFGQSGFINGQVVEVRIVPGGLGGRARHQYGGSLCSRRCCRGILSCSEPCGDICRVRLELRGEPALHLERDLIPAQSPPAPELPEASPAGLALPAASRDPEGIVPVSALTAPGGFLRRRKESILLWSMLLTGEEGANFRQFHLIRYRSL